MRLGAPEAERLNVVNTPMWLERDAPDVRKWLEQDLQLDRGRRACRQPLAVLLDGHDGRAVPGVGRRGGGSRAAGLAAALGGTRAAARPVVAAPAREPWLVRRPAARRGACRRVARAAAALRRPGRPVWRGGVLLGSGHALARCPRDHDRRVRPMPSPTSGTRSTATDAWAPDRGPPAPRASLPACSARAGDRATATKPRNSSHRPGRPPRAWTCAPSPPTSRRSGSRESPSLGQNRTCSVSTNAAVSPPSGRLHRPPRGRSSIRVGPDGPPAFRLVRGRR